MEPSPDALSDQAELHPCPTCGRTFLEKALQRHVNICEKVNQKKRNVFDGAKKRLQGLPAVPKSASDTSARKKSAKAEEEFKKCPHCSRNFGPKPYDRHVAWCEEKSKRLQNSPTKDLVALAKLHARVAYRPKTPNRGRDAFSDEAPDSPLDDADHASRKHSANRAGGISFLDTTEHTKETPGTQFIRAATGRGSIKRGPAPTKASVLRLQKSHTPQGDVPTMRSKTPSVARPVMDSPAPARLRRSMSPSHGHSTPAAYLIKPSAVRPAHNSRSGGSFGQRRDPDGVEHRGLSEDTHVAAADRDLGLGQYDHSREFDPLESAARQMKELLFGTQSHGAHDHHREPNLRPSSNSAFQRYVPSSGVPSTADINNKFGVSRPSSAATSSMMGNGQSGSLPRRPPPETQSRLMTSSIASFASRGSSVKVAKFCHECGNPFTLPDIRFCCECGVKRLVC